MRAGTQRENHDKGRNATWFWIPSRPRAKRADFCRHMVRKKGKLSNFDVFGFFFFPAAKKSVPAKMLMFSIGPDGFAFVFWNDPEGFGPDDF